MHALISNSSNNELNTIYNYYLDFKNGYGKCYTLTVLKSSLARKCGFVMVFNHIVCDLNDP